MIYKDYKTLDLINEAYKANLLKQQKVAFIKEYNVVFTGLMAQKCLQLILFLKKNSENTKYKIM